MGSECRANKFHYDIAMSKRTRKPSNIKEEANLQASHSTEESSEKVVAGEKENYSTSSSEAQESENKKSLKQLIEARSLSQHFSSEEKQIQLFKQQEKGLNRMKVKRVLSRYAKVLGHLIKHKRNPEMGFHKKPVLQLAK